MSFFHETLFDYAFARRWVARGQSVLEFLLAGEQELFRRAQVRQVLMYLRGYDAQRFVAEVRDVLNEPRVRYHVKESVFFILRGLAGPSQAEVQLMLELLAPESPLRSRAELAVRSRPWLCALDHAGVIEAWLASGDTELEGRAVTIVGNAGAADLLSAHRTHPDFRLWLKWVIRFVDIDRDRALFDLLLGAVQEGAFDEDEQELFMLTHTLGERAPEWAVELLAAWFAERPAAFEEQAGYVKALKSRDHGLNELIAKAAEGAPEAFVRRLLPYMQRVMTEAEHGDELPRSD